MCEHNFTVDQDGQVTCQTCGTRDDEMEPIWTTIKQEGTQAP